jgi:hypothetical protein
MEYADDETMNDAIKVLDLKMEDAITEKLDSYDGAHLKAYVILHNGLSPSLDGASIYKVVLPTVDPGNVQTILSAFVRALPPVSHAYVTIRVGHLVAQRGWIAQEPLIGSPELEYAVAAICSKARRIGSFYRPEVQ